MNDENYLNIAFDYTILLKKIIKLIFIANQERKIHKVTNNY